MRLRRVRPVTFGPALLRHRVGPAPVWARPPLVRGAGVHVEDATFVADGGQIGDITIAGTNHAVRDLRYVTNICNAACGGMTGAINANRLCQQTFRRGQVRGGPADWPGIGTGQSGFPGALLCVKVHSDTRLGRASRLTGICAREGT